MTRHQAVFAAGYFFLYLGYLFLHPEGELLHWLTLVLLPLAGLFGVGKFGALPALLRSIGLDARRLTPGLSWVLVLGVAFQILQFMNTRQRAEVIGILKEPWGWTLPFLAFGLLLLTVATTEEVFFRGILQSRLAAAFRSELAGLLLTCAAFVAYHVPYAYLNPAWPSVGNLGEAMQLAAANGIIGGLALGGVYWRSRHNLVAAILLHAFIDLVPATRLVHNLLSS